MTQPAPLYRAAAAISRKLPSTIRTRLALQLVRSKQAGRCIVSFNDVRLDLDLSDWLQRLYFVGGADDLNVSTLCHHTPVGGAFMDIGAYVGLYTCALAKKVGPTGEGVAIEPLQENVANLRRNLSLNALANVRIEEIAASDTEARMPLYVPASHPGGGTAATRTVAPKSWRTVGETIARRADDVAPTERRVSTVKIDVEGQEIAGLAGLSGVIERDRPLILIESLIANRGDLLKFCDKARYKTAIAIGNGRLRSFVPDARSSDFFLVPIERVSATEAAA